MAEYHELTVYGAVDSRSNVPEVGILNVGQWICGVPQLTREAARVIADDEATKLKAHLFREADSYIKGHKWPKAK